MLNFAEIFTTAGLVALGQVILIDLTMAGDNVVIMGTLTSGLPEKERRKVIMLGVGMALIFLIGFALIATALIDTGSKMDEVIFEEFKGTGNSEIVLDRKVSDKRIFPSLDVGKSGTRKEELLVDQGKLSKMWVLRRILMQMGTVDAMQFLLDKMKDSKTNEDFFASMNQ